MVEQPKLTPEGLPVVSKTILDDVLTESEGSLVALKRRILQYVKHITATNPGVSIYITRIAESANRVSRVPEKDFCPAAITLYEILRRQAEVDRLREFYSSTSQAHPHPNLTPEGLPVLSRTLVEKLLSISGGMPLKSALEEGYAISQVISDLQQTNPAVFAYILSSGNVSSLNQRAPPITGYLGLVYYALRTQAQANKLESLMDK